MEKPIWHLEGYLDGGDHFWRTALRFFPFSVGRDPLCELTLRSHRVSSRHATFEEKDGELWIADAGSLNGTFVNLERIVDRRRLREGDIVHFADQEFRIGLQRTTATSVGGQTLILPSEELRVTLPGETKELKEMLERGELEARFQPLVTVPDGRVQAHELLGGGQLGGKSRAAGHLFRIAESVDLAVTLSESLRSFGVEAGRDLGAHRLFVNTHPLELRRPDRLVAQLEASREAAPDLELVVEIHESAVTDIPSLKRLGSTLAAMGIEIAFDDFGTGQARLMELADATPRYVKFDVAWLAATDDGRRETLMGFLLSLCKDLEITTVAEGVETAGQAATVSTLGFDLVQGYYFGRPESRPKTG